MTTPSTAARASRLTVLCRGATPASRQARFSSDEPLPAGEAERASRLAGTLGRFEAVLHGPEASAAQTAAAFAPDAVACPALADVDFGRWTGRTLADIAAEAPQDLRRWMADPAAAPHGGESFETAQARAAVWLESLHGTGGHRLAVTHPVILKLLFAHVLGAPLSSVWRIDAEPFCLLSLSSEGTRWALRGFGPAIR